VATAGVAPEGGAGVRDVAGFSKDFSAPAAGETMGIVEHATRCKIGEVLRRLPIVGA
jgi:hypothetical protein